MPLRVGKCARFLGSVKLSGFNVVGGYAFGRELRLLKPAAAENPAAQLANMRWQRA